MRRHRIRRAALALAVASLALAMAAASTAAGPVHVAGKTAVVTDGKDRVALVRLVNTSENVLEVEYTLTWYRHHKGIVRFTSKTIVPPGESLIADTGATRPVPDEVRATIGKTRRAHGQLGPAAYLKSIPQTKMGGDCRYYGYFNNTSAFEFPDATVYFIALRSQRIVGFAKTTQHFGANGATPVSTDPAPCGHQNDVVKAYVQLNVF